MKIRTIRMWKDDWFCDWEISPNKQFRVLFACGDELLEEFPHISKRRKRLDMTVYTHAVKGAKRFTIKIKGAKRFTIKTRYHKTCYHKIYGVDHYCSLVGHEATFPEMKKIISSILNEQGKTEMFVWVTVD